MRPSAHQKAPARALSALDATVYSHHDHEAGLLVTERDAAIARDDVVLAIAKVTDRARVVWRTYSMPTLVQFLEIRDESFAEEVSDLFEVRRGHRRGRELRASGWAPAPVVVIFANGERREGQMMPPFLIETELADASFGLKEVTSD